MGTSGWINEWEWVYVRVGNWVLGVGEYMWEGGWICN